MFTQNKERWKFPQISPIFKYKGNVNNMDNYRPITNLCSASKLFEKPIMKRILEVQKDNNVDITGASQHGFKTGRSTARLSAELQRSIARA